MLFIAAVNTIMMPATSILFFIRLRAVYLHDKCIVTFFGSCWLVTVGFFVPGGVGHCFAWHVRVPSFCNIFIFLISMNMTLREYLYNDISLLIVLPVISFDVRN